MLTVEIVLIIIGIICICASFFVSRKKKTQEDDEAQVHGADLWTEKDEEVIIKHIDDILENRGMELVETTEDQMNRICNEKIMAIDEFSKPLMDKIHVNHEEVVFMYNMLGEKQKELQKMMEEDTVRRSVPTITSVEQTPEQEALPDPVSVQRDVAPEPPKPVAPKPIAPKPVPVSQPAPEPSPQAATGLDRARQKSQTIFAPNEKKDTSVPEVSTGKPIREDEMLGTSKGNEIGVHRTVFTAQQYVAKKDPVYEAPIENTGEMLITPVQPIPQPEPPAQPAPTALTGIQRLKPQNLKANASPGMTIPDPTPVAPVSEPVAPQQKLTRPSREMVFQHMEETAGSAGGEAVEDRIRMLYKQGKSVVEISKELNIGQGEVKLMIAMLKKRS
ncbi:MAG: DUF6115 domain-containing protein [Eubacterium sp.]|nr:DUF6115 domain-containing protein [Eubacterium sp.]